MEANGCGLSDQVGRELLGGDEYHEALRLFDATQPSYSYRSRLKNRVRSWAEELWVAQENKKRQETFAERLSKLRNDACLSYDAVAAGLRKEGFKTIGATIRAWALGEVVPHPQSREQILLLERILGVPEEKAGYLLEKLPTERYRPSKIEARHLAHLQKDLRYRVPKHLPDGFSNLPDEEREVILTYVIANILTAPREILTNECAESGGVQGSLEYAVGRQPGKHLAVAPKHLLDEIDEIINFKTRKRGDSKLKRNKKNKKNKRWVKDTAEKADRDLRMFFGALRLMGMPDSALSMSAVLAPDVIDKYIDWREERRGGCTRPILALLILLESLLHPEFGYVARSQGFGEPLVPLPGFVTEEDVRYSQDDWAGACLRAREHIQVRIEEVEEELEDGRDPFEALMPVLKSEQPLVEYEKIIDEIKDRMPSPRYEVRYAEARRALLMLRLGLELAFRQKNMRELLLCPLGGEPRSWKELKRCRRGEMSFDEERRRWRVRIHEDAFKNRGSAALDEEIEIVLEDTNGLYDDIAQYLATRHKLLGKCADPGTIFVTSVVRRRPTAEMDVKSYYNAYRSMIETYGIKNAYTGRGAIEGLRPHGPHAVRHVLATTLVKATGAFTAAADLLLDTEWTVQQRYAYFLPGDRHMRSRKILQGIREQVRGHQ